MDSSTLPAISSPTELDAQVSDDAVNLMRDSVSPNTRRAYKSALKTSDASGDLATDAGVANYLGDSTGPGGP